MSRTFSSYSLKSGLLGDFSHEPFPTLLHGWRDEPLALQGGATHFGFVHSGRATLRCESGTFQLGPGMYFAAPGAAEIEGGAGIAISRLHYAGFFHLGGPVEDRGRLRYIDGCTDSLLIPPVMQGDACLNLLHLPPRTKQTQHTHPSIRVGLIIRGEGHCVTPEERIALTPGQVFAIRPEGLHSFHTEESELLVLAYHPDSDFGPTHENHPMVNRTIIAESGRGGTA